MFGKYSARQTQIPSEESCAFQRDLSQPLAHRAHCPALRWGPRYLVFSEQRSLWAVRRPRAEVRGVSGISHLKSRKIQRTASHTRAQDQNSRLPTLCRRGRRPLRPPPAPLPTHCRSWTWTTPRTLFPPPAAFSLQLESCGEERKKWKGLVATNPRHRHTLRTRPGHAPHAPRSAHAYVRTRTAPRTSARSSPRAAARAPRPALAPARCRRLLAGPSSCQPRLQRGEHSPPCPSSRYFQ